MKPEDVAELRELHQTLTALTRKRELDENGVVVSVERADPNARCTQLVMDRIHALLSQPVLPSLAKAKVLTGVLETPVYDPSTRSTETTVQRTKARFFLDDGQA